MSDHFHVFGKAVNKQFERMARGELYLVKLPEGVDLFARYLASFPIGSNPVYRERTEHDCACCKQFVRRLGGVVALTGDSSVDTVWDIDLDRLPTEYARVAEAMGEYIRSLPIGTIFRTKEHQYGNEVTRETLADGATKRWNHFWGAVPVRFRPIYGPDPERGRFDSARGLLERSLKELKYEAVLKALELARGGQVYKGAEYVPALLAFQGLLAGHARAALRSARHVELFLLRNAHSPAAHFRNTMVGTLVQDLSNGVDEEDAVKSFEVKAAPQNYKRPTALVTETMVRKAVATVKELGLEQSLERRLARLEDLSVNDVLWVDRSARDKLQGGALESLAAEVGKGRKPFMRPEAGDVPVNNFFRDILPRATGLELIVRNRHVPNLVALTAPAHAGSTQMFKWPGDIGWSYNGGYADSIKEKVKRAGGNVDAPLRFSLAWFNYDDLDIHCMMPDGTHVFFANKKNILDVDMNAMSANTREPVENLAFQKPPEGTYEVWVHQFQKRETKDVGFAIQVAVNGRVTELAYDKAVAQNANVKVGRFLWEEGELATKYAPGMEPGTVSQQHWGLGTEAVARVQAVLLSPNAMGEQAFGPRHVFFVLEGCQPDAAVRGIYNEFLKPDLDQHRKVFEMLGNRTLCPPVGEAMCGLGFTAARGDSVEASVKAQDGSTRLYNINF